MESAKKQVVGPFEVPCPNLSWPSQERHCETTAESFSGVDIFSTMKEKKSLLLLCLSLIQKTMLLMAFVASATTLLKLIER